jgi:bifunctional UDP-N-acetylglucosamine pyrophosphorylase/glucosamine-1-phosphate N-acetyltransferase
MIKRNLAAIILAAGKGKRMNAGTVNKVTLHLNSKPIIAHIVHFMKKIGIETIVVVVGHAKESVITALAPEQVLFAEQEKQLGTGHAVEVALQQLPHKITDVFVVYGDDAVFYNQKHMPVMQKLFQTHLNSNAAFTFLTIEQDNPTGLGRIVRDQKGNLLAIIEEKDATPMQRKITEINPGCFVFSVKFLKKYLPQVEKSPITGEYYLTSLIDLAIKDNQKVQTVKGGKLAWRGVNTPEELQEAERLYSKITSDEL